MEADIVTLGEELRTLRTLVEGQRMQCFSCKIPFSHEIAKQSCDLSHREHWPHEWVSQRVIDLTDKLAKLIKD